jgi:hypothetical protein
MVEVETDGGDAVARRARTVAARGAASLADHPDATDGLRAAARAVEAAAQAPDGADFIATPPEVVLRSAVGEPDLSAAAPIATTIRDVGVFVPIVWTWYHLAEVFRATRGDESTTFLKAWQEGSGVTPLADVAMGVAAMVGAIVLLSLYIARREWSVAQAHQRLTMDAAELAASLRLTYPQAPSPPQVVIGGDQGPPIVNVDLGSLAPELQHAATVIEDLAALLRPSDGESQSVGDALLWIARGSYELAEASKSLTAAANEMQTVAATRVDEMRLMREAMVAAQAHQADVEAKTQAIVSSLDGVRAALEHDAQNLQSLTGEVRSTVTAIRHELELAGDDAALARRILTDLRLWAEREES